MRDKSILCSVGHLGETTVNPPSMQSRSTIDPPSIRHSMAFRCRANSDPLPFAKGSS